MQPALGISFVFCCALGLFGCGSDSKGSSAPAANGGAGGAAAGPAADKCHDGCIETLAAKCSLAPPDQASCESTCKSLETGSCGDQYSALQACAQGKPVNCGADGTPNIAACPDEQAAFRTCLNQ